MTFFVEGLSERHEPDTKVRRVGEYDTLDAAVSGWKRVIDVFLHGEFRSGMVARTLLARYRTRPSTRAYSATTRIRSMCPASIIYTTPRPAARTLAVAGRSQPLYRGAVTSNDKGTE